MSRRDQIQMGPEEIREFLHGRHTMTLATIGADGQPHLTAMWYGFSGDDIVFWTYRSAQKTKNLERDPRLTILVEDGEAYDQLRGVSLAGRGVLVTDPEVIIEVGRSIAERYVGTIDAEAARAGAARSAAKRVAVRVEAERVVTWDHRKLAGGY